MKNSAVKAMICNQFPWTEVDQVSVVFEISVDCMEEYRVSLVDDGVYKEFIVQVKMEQVK
ncbi:hypothetical protein D3C75_973460 [compost metagenome]